MFWVLMASLHPPPGFTFLRLLSTASETALAAIMGPIGPGTCPASDSSGMGRIASSLSSDFQSAVSSGLWLCLSQCLPKYSSHHHSCLFLIPLLPTSANSISNNFKVALESVSLFPNPTQAQVTISPCLDYFLTGLLIAPPCPTFSPHSSQYDSSRQQITSRFSSE